MCVSPLTGRSETSEEKLPWGLTLIISAYPLKNSCWLTFLKALYFPQVKKHLCQNANNEDRTCCQFFMPTYKNLAFLRLSGVFFFNKGKHPHKIKNQLTSQYTLGNVHGRSWNIIRVKKIMALI